MLNLIQSGACKKCESPIVYVSYAAPGTRPTPIKTCSCKSRKRGAFEREVRAQLAAADVARDDATEVMLVLGAILGRAQAAILNGDRAKLREHLVELTALGWKLGDDL